MRASHRLREAEGFTLIEAMMAMIIFLVGSLALVSLMLAVIKTNKDSYTLTEAVTAGRTEMERVLTHPDPSMGDTLCTVGTCTDFATCLTADPECAREVVVLGTDPVSTGLTGSIRFQVVNERQQSGASNGALVTVRVRWPRDEDLRGTPVGSGGVDCYATPAECKELIFNGRK